MGKKFSALTLIFTLMLIIFGGCGQEKSSSAKEEIKIGAVLPLTGEISSFGKSSKEALDMLVEDINNKGGLSGKKIKIIYEDDKNKPQNSVNALEKLINNEKIVAVIGSATSECSMAMGPIATQNKIPMITATATDPKVTAEGGEYVYRACFTNSDQGTALSKYVFEDLKKKTAAVIYNSENDYSKNLAEVFKSSFEKSGGKIVAFESYSAEEKSFSKQLGKVKQSNAEVLMLPDYYNVVASIVSQAKTEGIKSVLIGGDGWDSSELLKSAKDAVNGGFFSTYYCSQDTYPELVEFKKAYSNKYHKVPDGSSGLAYDAGKILLNAIEKCESTEGSKIKDAIKKEEPNLVSGKFKFSDSRDSAKPVLIIKIENDKQKLVKKFNP